MALAFISTDLLLSYGGLMQTFMYRSIKEPATCLPSQILLLLHDLAGTLRDKRLLLDLAHSATILKPFIHFSLPRLVILRERYIQVCGAFLIASW